MTNSMCPVCNGTGQDECTRCAGKGRTGGFIGIGSKVCPVCEGSGNVECGSCDAAGRQSSRDLASTEEPSLASEEDVQQCLRNAVKEEDAAGVKRALEAGAAPSLQDDDDGSALFDAVWNGNAEVVKLLVEHGGRVGGPSKYGESLMNYASGRGYVDIVRILLDHGGEAAYSVGNHPLVCAAREGHTDIMTLLLERGAGVNERDKFGQTALSVAAQADQLASVRLLVEHGGDPSIATQKGQTALSIAEAGNYTGIVEFLQGDVVEEPDQPSCSSLVEPSGGPDAAGETEAIFGLPEAQIYLFPQSTEHTHFYRIVATILRDHVEGRINAAQLKGDQEKLVAIFAQDGGLLEFKRAFPDHVERLWNSLGLPDHEIQPRMNVTNVADPGHFISSLDGYNLWSSRIRKGDFTIVNCTW